ncbi:unnamed protein product [Ambrosiozyma monospora]|uniref:Unnamed protein product n=1 Tax=Ambrosiozyma monospora TaxID=43982 RepID=A0A9W7DEG0_AMBMO|nr:unnamed protein product [Ambrosiozyma monospora]
MKFSISATFAATLLLASTEVFADGAESIQLFVKSKDKSVNGQFVSSVFEGSGTSYFFLGYNPANYVFNNNRIVTENHGVNQEFSVETNHSVILSTQPIPVKVEFGNDGAMSVNGVSDGFYACKNAKDPLNYSKDARAVMFFKSDDNEKPSKDDCVEITILKNAGAQSKAPYAPTSTDTYSYTGTEDLDATTDMMSIDISDYLTYIPSSVSKLNGKTTGASDDISGQVKATGGSDSGFSSTKKSSSSSSTQKQSSSKSKGDGASNAVAGLCTFGIVFAFLSMIV